MNLAHLQCEPVGVGFIRPETTGVINVAPTMVGVRFIEPAGLTCLCEGRQVNQAPTIGNSYAFKLIYFPPFIGKLLF